MVDIPRARMREQVTLARMLFPNALSISQVWKPMSRKLDVGVLVWLRDERSGKTRGQVLSLRRTREGAVIL